MYVLRKFRWLLLVGEILAALPIFYLCIVSLAAIKATRESKQRKTNAPSSTTQHNAHFAIVVPAHNEEVLLPNLLESLAQLDYPRDGHAVHIVADNCTDQTAALARKSGWVHVHERFDLDKRGKGFALNWLLQKLEEKGLIYDAYVFVDADSVVEPNFLQVMNKGLAEGAQALQAQYNVLNPAESSSSALRWIALSLMCHVRPLGRNELGGSSTLTGNGMCFSRSLLKHYPWQAFSAAEDYEYYLDLIQHGVRVRYMPEAIVSSPMPTTFAHMRTQDIRWESANPSRPKWKVTMELLKGGMQSRDFAQFEAVAEYLTPPLSFLVSFTLLSLVVSLFIGMAPEIVVSFLLLTCLVSYVSTGPFLLRPPKSVYKALLYAPGFMLWKVWVYLVLRKSKRHTGEWVRTARPVQNVSTK